MISKNEIPQKAREKEVPESTIERDYVQNWLLMALSSLPLVLKGGTGIRKVYVEDYRFSDDLDFTLLNRIDEDELREIIEKSVEKAREESGINFSRDIGFCKNDNGFEADVYFQLMQTGSNRTSVKIDITNCENERILLPVDIKKIIHPYSDDLNAEVKVYALEEMITEKIRSLFQRTRPRDLYDVWYMWDKVDRRKIFKILPEKFKSKNVEMDIKDFEQRKNDFEGAWKNSLGHQLKELPEFENVFLTVFEEVKKMLIDIISNNKENILIGEIGALLHDIGKCHPDFIRVQSLEHETNFVHENIDKFLKPELIDTLKKVKIKFDNEEKSVYDLIRYHHDAKGTLLKYLEKCDRLDSADDKGVVRKKQSKDDTIICSPFGFSKEKIDLQCLQKRLNDLESNLIGLFQNYVSGSLDIVCFRKCLMNNLNTTFSCALGETRIPANDVTLWDHSHSTASLFKSALCAMVLGEKPDKDKLQWRIFGFCWDGIGFINKGKEVADILQRKKIIDEMKRKLKDKFEEEIPIGNVIYEDNNGIYFTFPALNNNSEALAKECAKIGLDIIRKDSNDEIWPFFTLSKPHRTLTILTEELKFASKERAIPKMTPTLFIEGNGEITLDNPEIDTPKDGWDICPICRLRAKLEDDDRCDVCKERKKGRLDSWLSSRENTIWIDEVADDNNRIALLTLSFDLDKWLDGTMIGTIFSQTLEDWKNSKDAIKFFSNKQNEQKLKSKGININDAPINLSKNCLKIITDEDPLKKDPSKDPAFKSELINTFYEDVKSTQNEKDENYIEKFIDNLKVRVGPEPFNSSNLQKVIFTQNPSPARLYRIWKETDEFFGLVTKDIKGGIYSRKRKRLHFSADNNALKVKINLENKENTPLIIKINGLKPESILVIHTSGGEFYTIESLEKFKYGDKSGPDVVKDALSKGLYWISEEDKPDINLLKNGQNIKINGILSEEDYYPIIEITKSPLSMRLIVPASDSISILKSIVKLYNQRFEKVLGKLPFNIGLLVSKRKFPLYVLLDTGERLFHAKEFKKPEMMDAWWDINDLRNDEFYSFYPVTKFEDQKYNLDDLVPLSKGKIYSLYPGYFDFDLILGTQDRYNITYNEKRRANNDYMLFSKRPCYFYQFPQMIDLWEILNNNLSSSQINFIEESLTNKLREWRNVNEPIKNDVFRKFVEATIKDAFSSNWDKLEKETKDFILNSAYNGFLLDTIVLFNHTIKKGE